MDSNITKDTIHPLKAVERIVVKKERTVTTSLLRHFKEYYGVENAGKIQEMCEESADAR